MKILSMCRASISVLLVLLVGGMLAFATPFVPPPGAPQSGPMPCGGHHPCCISPAPQSIPALPAAPNGQGSLAVSSHGDFPVPDSDSAFKIACAVATPNLPAYSAFSTVLR